MPSEGQRGAERQGALGFSNNTGTCAIWSIRGVRGLGIMTTRGRLARVDAFMGTWRTIVGIQRFSRRRLNADWTEARRRVAATLP